MSKVLVDRELLELLQERLDPHRDAATWGALCDALRRAQPAEAEGADMDAILKQVEREFEMGGLSDGLYADYATEVAKRYASAALSAVTAERDRLLQGLAKSETNTMALMVKHFAGSMTSREQDRKLDECLSEGIAMLEAERDQYRAEVERLNAELLGRPWVC
jgi:hypothetical protein